jgi:4'-phosphopantetheinyl transferase EntD
MTKDLARRLLPRILDLRVAVVEHFGPPLTHGAPELDAGLLGEAVASRRYEFATGRYCAREACKQLGRPCDLIGVLPGRAPDWPKGLIGSITHCRGYIAAVACLSQHADFLGIDAEPLEPLPPELTDQVAFGREKDWLESADGSAERGRLLFSIKESVFKAWWPVYGSWLDFADVTVEITAEHSSFQAFVCGSARTTRLQGRFVVDHGLIATAVLQ